MTMLATAFLGGLLAAAPQATTAQSAWPHWLGPTRDGRAASTAWWTTVATSMFWVG